MKVGVTGGQGFIGKWTVETLRSRGHEVLILDHKKRQNHLEDSGVDYLWGDVRDDVTMLELAAHVDGIIHLAAVLGTQETIGDPRPAAITNLEGGLNFLHAIQRYDIPGVYICVGNHWMNNPYSISKTAVERFCLMYQKEHGTRVNQVRAVNAYGPRQEAAPPFGSGKVRKIIPAFVCRALTGNPIEIYGDGKQVSDMVWIGDLALSLTEALEHASRGDVYGHVLECGPREHRTVLSVAKIVRDIAAEITGIKVDIKHLPMRPGEIPGDIVSADPSTLSSVGLTEPSMDLVEGISRTVKWFHCNPSHWKYDVNKVDQLTYRNHAA